jgi:CBS domain containing-hemolysin-like protein
VILEAVAAVSVTLLLTTTGLGWWQVLLISVLVVASVAVLVVRQLPRAVGRRHPAGSLMITSGVLTLVCAALAPVRRITSRSSDQVDLSDEEIRQMVDRVSESEHMEDDEREMFRSVLELGETITRAVVVPRTEMITLPSGTPVRKALALFLRSGYSRVPVVGESVDDVLGVLYLKDVVRRRHTTGLDSDEEPVDSLLRPAAFVPESKPVDDLLREMQQGASHMAMVVDEFGGIAGLVTIEDALEEIVGELTDEHDHTGPEVEDLGDGSFRVPSRMPIDELGELFDLELDDDEVDTAGGLLAKVLGKVPLVGSSAEIGGLRLTADRVEGRRKQVATLLVRREHPDTEGSTTPRTTSPHQGAQHR